MHEFSSCIPIFKYPLAVANVEEPLHNKSLVALYHFCPTPLRSLKFYMLACYVKGINMVVLFILCDSNITSLVNLIRKMLNLTID